MIKETIILILIIVLSGCSIFGRPKFDNNVNLMLSEIRISIDYIKENCGDDPLLYIIQVKRRSEELLAYTENIGKQSHIYEAISIIDNDIKQLVDEHDKLPTSLHFYAYCRAKTDLINKKIVRTMQTYGGAARL